MTDAKLIFPHQLFEQHPLLDIPQGNYILIEEYLFFKQYPFHKRKIAFHRATMKYYESFLLKKGLSVRYIASGEDESDLRQLIPQLKQIGVERIHTLDPTDCWLQQRLEKGCRLNGIELHLHPSPLFLNTPESLGKFFAPAKKKFLQAEFYKLQRLQQNLWVNEDKTPVGGQWSFDVENRKKFPKNKIPPPIDFPRTNSFYQEAYVYTKEHFTAHFGELSSDPIYPIDFDESSRWLQQFLENRLAEFGDYEDAIVRGELILHHSMLTPLLNVGLLTPTQILSTTLAYAHQHHIPMNSLEGFVRQILGWREFIRGVYLVRGSVERTTNFWNFNNKMPSSFYTGSTGILPVDETIKKILQTGYCHHIERLMILGNFMLLCEIDPDDVYQWFMELFIDAYDWVMVPNVYGMSQFADGGVMSTKPYISGSNYIMKMSNYPKGEWQQIWDALFWRFMNKQRKFFNAHPRLGMLIRTFDRWDDKKKSGVLLTAENYLKKLNQQ